MGCLGDMGGGMGVELISCELEGLGWAQVGFDELADEWNL